MALIISEFFGLIGLDMTPPATLSELIPYLLVFFVGVVLVSGVFRVIGRLSELFASFKGW